MVSRKILVSAALMSTVLTAGTPAQAGSEPFIGEIVAYGSTYCPRGWAPADGSLLPISENDALFTLYGTTYGGDGQQTFALPDLRGRAAFGDGSSFGNVFVVGQKMGSESFTVTTAAMPAHTHTGTLLAVPVDGNTNIPTGNSLARDDEATKRIYTTEAPENNMNAGDVVIGSTGSGAPVELTAPALSMSYCVALFGVFPQQQ